MQRQPPAVGSLTLYTLESQSMPPPHPWLCGGMPMRRVIGAFVATMVIALLAVTAADARRAATTSERRAIAGQHPRCWRVYVSSVDSRYASLEFNTKTYRSADCAPLASDGIDIYRRRDGRWRHVSGMSDCPSRLPGVPPAVYRDLTRAYCR